MTTIIERPVQGLEFCAKQINQTAQAIERNLERAIHNAVECGRHLLEAKKQCKHGEFQNWIAENCNVKFRQAQKYMRLNENWPLIQDKANAHSDARLTVDKCLDLIAVKSIHLRNGEELEDWEMDLHAAIVSIGKWIGDVENLYQEFKNKSVFPFWIEDVYDAAFYYRYKKQPTEEQLLNPKIREIWEDEKEFFRRCHEEFKHLTP